MEKQTILLWMTPMILIILPVNHVIYAQLPVTNTGITHTIPLKIADRSFPIKYTIEETKVFGNYSIGPISKNKSLTNTLLGNIIHTDAAAFQSRLVITTNSTIGIALTLEIPRNVSMALTKNVNKAENQNTNPLSVNGQQIFGLICPKDNVTKIFIPSISSKPQNITINFNANSFKASSIEACNHIN